MRPSGAATVHTAGLTITAGRFVVAYTHQFGNGISGTLSLEDTKERKRGNYNGANALSILGVAPAVDTRGGNTWPEIVGQLRIDQAWGGFHLAANVMNNHVAYNCGGASGTTTVAAGGCSELSGNPSDKVGGGVTAALQVQRSDRRQRRTVHRRCVVEGRNHRRVPHNGLRHRLARSTAVRTASPTTAASAAAISAIRCTPRRRAPVQATTVGPTGQQLTTAYGGSIAFEHGWNAEWRTSVFGGVELRRLQLTANAILCSRFAAGSATGTLTVAPVSTSPTPTPVTSTCASQARARRTYWTPVRDLTIGVEFQWLNVHAKHADNVVYNQPVISGFKPNAAYEFKDQNVFSGHVLGSPVLLID